MDKTRNTRRPSTIRLRKKRGIIPVQVSYAHPDTSVVMTLHVKPGTTIREAVEMSGIQKIVKKNKLLEGPFGIFGEIRPPETPLAENDRIEIYRPLKTTPVEARKKRLKGEKSGKTASEQPVE